MLTPFSTGRHVRVPATSTAPIIGWAPARRIIPDSTWRITHSHDPPIFLLQDEDSGWGALTIPNREANSPPLGLGHPTTIKIRVTQPLPYEGHSTTTILRMDSSLHSSRDLRCSFAHSDLQILGSFYRILEFRFDHENSNEIGNPCRVYSLLWHGTYNKVVRFGDKESLQYHLRVDVLVSLFPSTVQTVLLTAVALNPLFINRAKITRSHITSKAGVLQ
jgi:hypothetical protein